METESSMPNRRSRTTTYSRCVCAAVRRTNRAITQLYDAVLSPTGLKATQFILLHAIADYGTVPQWQLAHENAMSVETLSRRLATLRKKDLVELTIGNHHGEHMYRLTGAGKDVLQRALPFWQRAQDRLEQVMQRPSLGEIVAIADEIGRAAAEAQELKTRNVASAGEGA
jgi:DNA-binding MarR family transcriptional regulator